MPNNLELAFTLTEQRLRAQLEMAMFPDHPVAKGDIAENAWREVMSEYLPSRYSVSPGFVVDTRGECSREIDCIVYDGFYAPKLFGEQRGYVYVPVEAVHAVFEIKQGVEVDDIKDASDKAASVRRLTRNSREFAKDEAGKYSRHLPPHIIGGLCARHVQAKRGIRAHSVRNAVESVMADRVNPEQGVDVILTASSGFLDFFDSGFPPLIDLTHLDEGNGALMRGLFRIISAMQIHEDPPGPMWLEYANGKRTAGWLTDSKVRSTSAKRHKPASSS